MTSAPLLNELREAGLLFESDPQHQDGVRDWLRPSLPGQSSSPQDQVDGWTADLVDSVSAISR